MLDSILPAVTLISLLNLNPFGAGQSLATHQISLDNRYPIVGVNEVFKDNILLNLHYLDGRILSPNQIKWDEVNKPFQHQFKLEPGQTFAFHEDVLTKYQGKIAMTTQAHFNGQEGFKSDGYLMGDGVCHLASLINWVAKDAGLEVESPANHDFMPIPEIDRKYGTAIYFNPGAKEANARQNLYVTNTKSNTVTFTFDYKDSLLSLDISEG